MLNSIYQLGKRLEAQGLLEAPCHKTQIKINQNWLLWIGVDPKGNYEARIEQNTGNTLKIQIDNHKNWPGLAWACQLDIAPPASAKGASLEENLKGLTDTLLAQDILPGCTNLAETIAKKSALALTYLPETSQLAKSAKTIAELLQKQGECQKLVAAIQKAITGFLNASVRTPAKTKGAEKPARDTEDAKTKRDILNQIFTFKGDKQPTKIPVVIGLQAQTHATLGGRLVEEAASLMKESNPDNNNSLFSPNGDRPALKNYPLMGTGYFPVARPTDFPALGGYFGPGSFSPISNDAMTLVRATFDYLTNPANKLYRRITLGNKNCLLLACPSHKSGHERTQAVLHTICPHRQKNEALDRIMAFEEAAARTLYPDDHAEEPEEKITLLVLAQPIKSNIHVYLEVTKPFEEWRKIFLQWKNDQVLDGGWNCLLSNREGANILDAPEILAKGFRINKESLETAPDNRNPNCKGADFAELLQNKPGTIRQLQTTLLGHIATHTAALLASKTDQNPNRKYSTAEISLKQSMGLLILATKRIQKTMNDTPLQETTGFLIGQALHQLNRLETAYRNTSALQKGARPTPGNGMLKGSKIVHIAESPNLTLCIHTITKDAKPYTDLADRVTRAFINDQEHPSEEKKPEALAKAERSLASAAKDFRATIEKIGEVTKGLTLCPKSPQEILQHKALVRIGINSRAPKPDTKTPEAKS